MSSPEQIMKISEQTTTPQQRQRSNSESDLTSRQRLEQTRNHSTRFLKTVTSDTSYLPNQLSAEQQKTLGSLRKSEDNIEALEQEISTEQIKKLERRLDKQPEQSTSTHELSKEQKAAACVLYQFMLLNNPKSVGKYKTNPRHPFDKLLWWPLRPLMLLRASGKITHWWHWHDLPSNVDITEKGRVLKGNPETFSTQTGNRLRRRINNIRMSLGGWQQIYIVGLKDEDAYKKGWRYAYEYENAREDGSTERKYSAVISHSPISILQSQGDVRAVGIEADSFDQLALDAVGPFPYRGRLPIF